ncbi:hypothetical protein MCU_00806 [Bartonella elizabethae Re6043vi]|uniref:Uncharacterized protein n=2 Tax=Bartonella elizabethae TaxID=807 RepID=J0RCZ5_BAREL|nr:hypothetical protein [Bartonella elizabethae]EJF84138.1 hypothetical protein MCU_00806 [Bartonella elizabethae Re6043vi]EJF96621.1 hypothetical protein MEE_00520 [Bartonella elizabethae F9251 = ATCC 49927]VEJ39992.1 Uncharacterised protein [Bartonella elizabethae]
MKRTITFIILSSLLILLFAVLVSLGYTKVSDLNLYDELYQSYLTKNSGYCEKGEIAKEYIKIFNSKMEPVISTE